MAWWVDGDPRPSGSRTQSDETPSDALDAYWGLLDGVWQEVGIPA